MPIEDDKTIETILRGARTIAVVGASPKPWRDSGTIASFLAARGYTVIPVNPAYQDVLGMKCYPDLVSIGSPVDIVDIFRNPDEVLPVIDEAIAIGAKTVWMQLGVVNEEAAATARQAGLTVIMDRCPKIEYGRFCGELGWMGVNRKLIDNRKSALFGKGGSLKRPDGKPRRSNKAD